MHIACPNCAAEYDVPEALLAAGPRLLRCARCGHQFQAAGSVASIAVPVIAMADAAPAVALPAVPLAATEMLEAAPTLPDPLVSRPLAAERMPDAEDERPPPTRGLSHHSPIDPPPVADRLVAPEPERSAAPLALAWLLSLAVLAGAAWAGWAFRTEIVEMWPPAARLYVALGLG